MAYNIIFMGTPDFAVPALKKLQKGEFMSRAEKRVKDEY